jgi:hypothetical protein
VVFWMLRHNPKFSLKLEYVRAKHFAELHPDVFGGRWSGPTPAPSWTRVRVAVEYHASTERLYHYVAPRLRALRAKYRAANGRLLAFTTVVDPAAAIRSFYRMWPPRRADRTLVPLVEWVEQRGTSSAIITRSLSNGASGCNTHRAVQTLHTFDHIVRVGKNASMRSLCVVLGWAACPRFPYRHLVGPLSNETQLQIAATPAALLEPAARCDRRTLALAGAALPGRFLQA